jgi:PhzF family phenazine biosynthesis protein
MMTKLGEKMTLPIYQVDAFASKLFSGNPAAVVPLNKWLDDEIMQNIAAENNLAETAFFFKDQENYNIRWMTPVREVNLCGHATLASAFVIFNFIEKGISKINFSSRSGILSVEKNDELLTLDFPTNIPLPTRRPDGIAECFEREPIEILEGGEYLFLVFDSEEYLRNYKPNFDLLKRLHPIHMIITAPGKNKNVDFVSRMFAPNLGINEDPVTGSAHTVLTPYWSARLGKNKLIAHQLSQRGGELFCENHGNRVKISGTAVLYLTGSIFLNF